MMGVLTSSIQIRALQSPMLTKYFPRPGCGLRSSEYTGPWCPWYAAPTRSCGFFALRLHIKTVPCSVPIMNLVGPAKDSYSTETAPSTVSEFLSFRHSSSTGSTRRLVSHQYTIPSVLTEKHSVPVLDCSQSMSYTGSRWDFSIGDVSTGPWPFLTSQYPTWPLYIPPDKTLESFSLYLTQHSWEGGLSSKCGRFGVFTSQMYELLDMPSGCCWKPKMLYAMAHLGLSPVSSNPGFQLM